MLEALSRDYVRVMEANGFSRRSIVYRHALRNATIPVVTVMGVFTVSLLGSAVVIENLFAYPGIGSLAASAAAQHDLPLIQGAVIYFTLIVIFVGLLLDISYSLIDPRVRVH
jgi:peptide/nickel transport system permease protein